MRTHILLSVSLLAAGSIYAQTLDTTTFVVMGEGLAAGMANFGLSSVVQNQSFPARIAASMNTGFNQPLMQPPGIGDVVGYPGQEIQLQRYPQGSVRQFYLPTDPTKDPIQAPPLFVLNTSVPGLTLQDSVTMRPVPPVVQKDAKQTVFNMILGFPQLILNNVPLWTQFEYAKNLYPTMALVELGYYEALDAAVNADPARIPDAATFGGTYGTIVAGLRGLQAQVIVTTIPNPLDTAYFSSVTYAADFTRTLPLVLTAGYHIAPQDYVTRTGLQAMAFDFLNGKLSATLPAGSVLTAGTAQDITNRINALNAQIVNVAKQNGAIVYDLNAYLHKVKVTGVAVGTSTVNGDYFNGFYSLDAVYPGATGHALIANDILALLNSTYHKSFPLVDTNAIASTDPARQYKKPQGTLYTPKVLGMPLSDFGEGQLLRGRIQ